MKIIRIVSLSALGLLPLTATHAQEGGPGKNVAAPQVQGWMNSEVADARAADYNISGLKATVIDDFRSKQGLYNKAGQGTQGGLGKTVATLQVPAWMSSEVGDAWAAGFKGSGVTVIVIDDFLSNQRLDGNLGQGSQFLRHGEWTLKEASMIAPSATMRLQDFNSSTTVALSRGLNVLNLSYSIYAPAGYTATQLRWSAKETSIISYAKNGTAVIVKAAGNDSVAIGSTNASGKVDYLNVALKGTKSAIYVGALNTNGTTSAPATLAYYSNKPGADAIVQRQFLVVGVDGAKTGLYGTSFAAPVISGYSAILGSKFTTASSTQITNQLLNTARQDTISNFNAATHGRGEASITRALAPVSIR